MVQLNALEDHASENRTIALYILRHRCRCAKTLHDCVLHDPVSDDAVSHDAAVVIVVVITAAATIACLILK